MKQRKKTNPLTFLIFAIFLVNCNSSGIEFSPGEIVDTPTPNYISEPPKNIILFMADGMGFGHLSLAQLSQQSKNTPSVWSQFEIKTWHDPRSHFGPLTDSEASATAIATGTSTNFGHIGIDIDGNHLKNIFEMASQQNYSTGIVTDSYVWDGTPSAFVAHIRNEDDARNILTQMAESELDLLFGELEDLGEGDIPEKEESLEILRKRFLLLDSSLELPDKAKNGAPVAAIFQEDEVQDMDSSPNLLQLTKTALDYMSAHEKPFMLLVECEEIDSASHENDTKRVIRGLKSIQETLSFLLHFSKEDGETLLIFTSDHETGGFAALGDYNNYPKMRVRWTTKEHSAEVVPFFATGPGANYFGDIERNIDIGNRLKKIISRDTLEAYIEQ
ncbi:MAG: alkaline phosphatase [Aureisphaera sp.]